jgi:hypothetical protein
MPTDMVDSTRAVRGSEIIDVLAKFMFVLGVVMRKSRSVTNPKVTFGSQTTAHWSQMYLLVGI